MYRSVRRPRRSINQSPTKVNTRLVTPIPTDCSNAALDPSPVSSKIRGAKYKTALMPDNWLKKAIKIASRMGLRCWRVQKCPEDLVSAEAAVMASASVAIRDWDAVG